MAHQASCPACGIAMQLPDDSPGRGFQCVRCRSSLVTTTGGQLIAQAQLFQPTQPLPPPNPFAEAPGGFSYPGQYVPGPFAPGYIPVPMSRDVALAKVQGPGLVLQIAGGLVVLAAFSSLLIMLIPEAREDEATPLILGVTVPLGLATGIFTMYCGSQLKALRSYVLVMVGVVLLLIAGLMVCPLVALPGIWPLIVMLDTGVKAHFGTPQPRV